MIMEKNKSTINSKSKKAIKSNPKRIEECNEKRLWKFRAWESVAMILLISFNFFIINYFFYSYSEGINNGKYGILLCVFEIAAIYWIAYKYYKNFEPIVIFVLIPFAIINYIMDSKIREKFISNEIYKEHFFHTGKIVDVIYGSHNSTIKLLTTNGNISVPIENPIDTIYKVGHMIVYGFCKKQHHLWVENSNPSIETCLKFLFPKLFEKGEIMDSINSCYIEKYLQEKGVNLVYKAEIVENLSTDSYVKLKFLDCTFCDRFVTYEKSKKIFRRDCDTLLLYENTNNLVGEHVTVCSMQINNRKNRAKISDYGYIFGFDIYSKEEIENNYPQIKKYVEKYANEN